MKAIGRIGVLLLGFAALSAQATFHLWRMTEVYSNAAGDVQFLEMSDCCTGEQYVGGHVLTVTPSGGSARTFTIPFDLPSGATSGRRMLIGTQSLVALGITPDYIVPDGFFAINGGTINWAGVDNWTTGALPTTNGLSLYRDGSQAMNSPTNFDGETQVLNPSSDVSRNYQGLWWRSGGSESGWGINIVQQGDILFASWFTYDTDGTGMWLYTPNAAKTGTGTYSGELRRNTGPAFNSSPFDSSQVHFTTVGTGTFTFTDADNGIFSYTVNGVAQTKPIQRFNFSAPVPTCVTNGTAGATPNYTDLWWNSPANSESGWGVNIVHQGDTLFMSWFTYAAGGKGQWLYSPNATKTTTGVYSGDLRRNTGAPFSAFNTAQVQPASVGTATFTFTSANTVTFAYTLDGITQTKTLTRFVYGSPPTVCSVSSTGDMMDPGTPGYPGYPG